MSETKKQKKMHVKMGLTVVPALFWNSSRNNTAITLSLKELLRSLFAQRAFCAQAQIQSELRFCAVDWSFLCSSRASSGFVGDGAGQVYVCLFLDIFFLSGGGKGRFNRRADLQRSGGFLDTLAQLAIALHRAFFEGIVVHT